MESIIDLRSDVVTPGTPEMWDAMRGAELKCSLTGQNDSVRELEELAADLLGMEAALFVATCSMANLLALMTLGERGTQAVLESKSHIACLEHWGAAFVCGLFTRPVEGARGIMDAQELDQIVCESRSFGLPRTSLVCLENSHNNAGGIALDARQTAAVADVAHRHGAAVHLDGARLFNSAAALGVPASVLAESVDTVAISLNKGLSAPFGALFCGSRQAVEAARINQGRIGGATIHKEGLLAAAGRVALKKMVSRLGEDNRRARQLAGRLAELPGLNVDLETVQTNIVLAEIVQPGMSAQQFVAGLAKHNIMAQQRLSDRQIRFVTHRLIGENEIRSVAAAVAAVLSRQGSKSKAPGAEGGQRA